MLTYLVRLAKSLVATRWFLIRAFQRVFTLDGAGEDDQLLLYRSTAEVRLVS